MLVLPLEIVSLILMYARPEYDYMVELKATISPCYCARRCELTECVECGEVSHFCLLNNICGLMCCDGECTTNMVEELMLYDSMSDE